MVHPIYRKETDLGHRFTFFCTPQEFADRLQDTIVECQLVPFKRHQATNEVLTLADVPFDSTELELGWQWDLWLGKSVPPSGLDEIPARAGWILMVPPNIDHTKKSIESADIGVRSDWVEPPYDRILKNPEVEELYKEVKKRFARKVKRGPAFFVAHGRADRAYYTQGALQMQEDGWLFRDIGIGPIRLGAEDIADLEEQR
jgi:hypothetical protein